MSEVAHDLIDLGFRVRTVNALLRSRDKNNQVVNEITTLDQLANCSLSDILRRRGAGRKTLADCASVLSAHGYKGNSSKFLFEWNLIKEI